MLIADINKKIEQYSDDEKYTLEEQSARIHILKSELVKQIDNNKIKCNIDKIVECRDTIKQIADVSDNLFIECDTLGGFQFFTDEIDKSNDSIKYYAFVIESSINDIFKDERERILDMAKELDLALGLEDVVYPCTYTEAKFSNNRGEAFFGIRTKDDTELDADYKKAFGRIHELYDNGILDSRTKSIAEINLSEIYNKSKQVGTNYGELVTVPTEKSKEKEQVDTKKSK